MSSILLAQATDTVDWGTTTTAADTAADTAVAATGLAVFGGFFIVMMVIGLASLAIWIWALVDVIKRQFTNPSDKTLWMVLVIAGAFVLGPILPIVYLIVGRKKGTIPGGSSPAAPQQ
ncbi:MAG: hypothetical protein UT28_C0001G0902 [Berkelbacteria bacterium GW2011_GWE1_39_12]|uniref:Cardiolipin synthase N-terminal domain-containing protein n=1 Tax=Berkelbacteria bacterium GW2011_GWE1_39_12 TaxID=1618337 RepID=A0A0G4B470_9BACT|nr:MAG: hypothetical protein UT28_C0001G0902 [Berkelbacteria bacterium GW2011_GWE1_39_12]